MFVKMLRISGMRILVTIALFTFGIGTTYSKGKDSLSVYPNPFADSATIYFELEKSDTISLKIYNLLGQAIVTYFEKTVLPNGSYSVVLKGDSLPDGIYNIQLKIGSAKQKSQRVIKLASASIKSESKNIQFDNLLFPNPTSGHLNIPIDGKKTILIADMTGRILRSFETDLNIVSVSDLPDGEYAVTVLSDQKQVVLTQKMIKGF
jgi:hypothetical protein